MEENSSLHVSSLHDNKCGTSGRQMSTCMASSSTVHSTPILTQLDASLPAPTNPPTVIHQDNPSASTTPIFPSPNVRKHTRGRFAEEYGMFRRKQNEYYDLLIQQTKREHQEQLRVYQVQLEAAEKQCQVYEAQLDMCTAIKNRIYDTCSHMERLGTEIQSKIMKQ